MSGYTDAILARLNDRPEADDESDEDSALSIVREPDGGLDPFTTPRKTPGQLALSYGKYRGNH